MHMTTHRRNEETRRLARRHAALRDHRGIRHRIPGHTSKPVTRELGARLGRGGLDEVTRNPQVQGSAWFPWGRGVRALALVALLASCGGGGGSSSVAPEPVRLWVSDPDVALLTVQQVPGAESWSITSIRVGPLSLLPGLVENVFTLDGSSIASGEWPTNEVSADPAAGARVVTFETPWRPSGSLTFANGGGPIQWAEAWGHGTPASSTPALSLKGWLFGVETGEPAGAVFLLCEMTRLDTPCWNCGSSEVFRLEDTLCHMDLIECWGCGRIADPEMWGERTTEEAAEVIRALADDQSSSAPIDSSK